MFFLSGSGNWVWGAKRRKGKRRRAKRRGTRGERGRLRNGAEIYGVLRRPWGPSKKDVQVRKEVVGVPQEQTYYESLVREAALICGLG